VLHGLLVVAGKGSKRRRIPFSCGLRRVPFRYAADRQALLFATRHGKKLGRRNVLMIEDLQAVHQHDTLRRDRVLS
jgi:site-specific recombinase XerC